jgi:class 3 adenylate cyclase
MMAGTPSPRFRLSLLGGFELTGPDGVVDLPSKKLAGLLAYLACTAPQRQPRERLSALLWGSHFEAQAKQNLRQALSRLRRVLGQDALESDGEVVSLNAAAILCDVSRFEALVREGSRDALRAAADLYRGEFIVDVTVSEEGWNEWLTGERERLLELAVGALMKLGGQELAAGRAEHALKAGQRAIALNNMREDAHRLILRALSASGRKAEALKHYQDLVALLKRELNTEPDAATKSLVAELRSTQPQSTPPAVKEIAKPEEEVTEKRPTRGDVAPLAMVARSATPERRQLTIMVCTMVGSTPLLADLDPEEMSERIAPFHKVVADVAARFGGFVAQYLGDCVHVYFGYPEAHEHDPEQAVRAGLGLLDAVGTLKASSGVTFRARAGIATGLVVVGEQLGTGNAQQGIAIGETPNLAARLQTVAAPGEVVIAANTWRLVGGMFDCRALGADELKGLPPSVEAWQVRGESAGVSRFEARRAGKLSPFVGRQEEMDLLLRRWQQTKLGEGRVVLLSGEPGIGKSRIAETLLTRLEGESHARLRYFCSPHRTQSPLYPSITQLEQAANFEPGSSAAAKLDKLEALLKPTAKNAPRELALIAELLGVPTDGRYPALTVSPQQKREMTLTALLDQLDGVAARSSALIVFEDIHWIDPTSLDLLDRTIAHIADLPVLLVATFRAEFQPAWVGQPHVTMLPLSRLGRRDSAGMLNGLTKGRVLPDAVVEQVIEHTDGVPLFIEELTSTLLESGLLRETTDRYVLDEPLPPLAVPATLQASLVARLDLLGSAKEVAQIGAAIGRQFSYELISAVSASSVAVSAFSIDLDAALGRLTASGLISRRGTPPIATYSFKHALVQDAAYATLLKSRRRQLHASIAKVLVERFSALADGQPEIVAQHFTEAGLASEAIGYWLKAGRLAYARWANREAVKCFEQALHLLEALPETRERLEQTIDLRIDLRNALSPLGEFERVFACLREAENLARTLDDQRRLGQLSVYMCHNFYVSGHPKEALAFGQNAQAIGDSLGDLPLQVAGNTSLGGACLFTGDYRRAEACLLKVLQLLDGELSRERFGLAGYPAVLARALLSWAYTDLGNFDEGISQCQEATRLAEGLNHPYDRAFAWWVLAHLHTGRGELGQAVSLLERGLALTHEWHLNYFSVMDTGSLGYAYALSGRIAEGIPLLEHALNAVEPMGYGLVRPLFGLYLAEAYVLANRLEDALPLVRRALTLAREGGGRGDEARALRLLGDVTARLDSPEDAEGHYRDALALAEELGMRPLVARCYFELGRLYPRTGKREQAQKHLTTATTMCRDMGMTHWLEQAEAEMRQQQ